jgi:hypothetical protein
MLILANVLVLALVAADGPPPAKATTPASKPEAQELWHLTLPEAIRIGLDNSEVIRVISDGMPKLPVGGFEPIPNNSGILIARVNADASIWNFKSAVMAHVRSIEQQYWALSFVQFSLSARETAVKLGEEILARERSKQAEGRSTDADVAEAQQHLDNFKLNLVSATSDVMTTEKQLRNILGLPAVDNRRIVPDTMPSETEVDPNWEACVATMLDSQPNIARYRQEAGVARLKAMIEAENPTLPADQRAASKRQLESQQAALQQIVHQSTHSLARAFLEIDANYKQFKTAKKLLESGQNRLEAQRAIYEEGKGTVDRLLDAVSQHANAIGLVAQYKSSYNTSLAAFEEARGTILACNGIIIAPKAAPSKANPTPRDDRVAPTSFEAPVPPPAPAPAPIAPVAPAPAPVKAQPTATIYKLKATFGVLKGLDLELEVCPGPK